jgi:hypothetical protein
LVDSRPAVMFEVNRSSRRWGPAEHARVCTRLMIGRTARQCPTTLPPVAGRLTGTIRRRVIKPARQMLRPSGRSALGESRQTKLDTRPCFGMTSRAGAPPSVSRVCTAVAHQCSLRGLSRPRSASPCGRSGTGPDRIHRRALRLNSPGSRRRIATSHRPEGRCGVLIRTGVRYRRHRTRFPSPRHEAMKKGRLSGTAAARAVNVKLACFWRHEVSKCPRDYADRSNHTQAPAPTIPPKRESRQQARQR